MINFSVIIPLYNKENYILKTIASVIQQTNQNFEIIIVDDGSTDNGVILVEKLKNPKIRLIRQKNSGVSAARNKGIQEAKYDYCAFLDADDEWKPKYLEVISRLISDYPNASGFCTGYDIQISGALRKLGFWPYRGNSETGLIGNYFLSRLKGNSLVFTSAICVKKGVLIDLGGFEVGEKMGEDQDLWIKLVLKYDIAFSRRCEVIYYLGLPESACRTNLPDENIVHLRNLRKFIENREVPNKLLYHAKKFLDKELIGLAIMHLLNGSELKGRSLLFKGNFLNYFWKRIGVLFISVFPVTPIKKLFKIS